MEGEDTGASGGDWGPDFPDLNATADTNGVDVQSNGILDNSTVSNGNDQYGGIWNSVGQAFQQGLNYAVAKDAAKHGLVRTTTPTGQTAYTQRRSLLPQGANGGAVLLLVGVAVGAVILAKAVK